MIHRAMILTLKTLFLPAFITLLALFETGNWTLDNIILTSALSFGLLVPVCFVWILLMLGELRRRESNSRQPPPDNVSK